MYSVQSSVFNDFYVKVEPLPTRRVSGGRDYLVYELAKFENDIQLSARGIVTGHSRHLFVDSGFDPAAGLPTEVYLVDADRENVKLWMGECFFRAQ